MKLTYIHYIYSLEYKEIPVISSSITDGAFYMEMLSNNENLYKPFDRLLDKYSLDYDELAREMAIYDLKGNENDMGYQKKLSNKKKGLKSDIKDYGNKLSTPKMRRLFIMRKIIGCSLGELLSTLNLPDDLKELLSTLPLDAKNLSDSDIKLIKKGYAYKCLESKCDFQFHVVERWLKLTKCYKVLCYQNSLTKLKDLISHNVKGKPISINFRNEEYSFIEGSSINRSTVQFSQKALGRGEVAEFVLDAFCEEIDVYDSNFYITRILNPTDLLKVSGTLLGLDESTLIKFRKHKDNYSYSEGVEPIAKANLFLDKNLSFNTEIVNPDLGSVLQFDWSESMKVLDRMSQ